MDGPQLEAHLIISKQPQIRLQMCRPVCGGYGGFSVAVCGGYDGFSIAV